MKNFLSTTTTTTTTAILTVSLLWQIQQGWAFPSFIVNSCARSLAIGETIMGFPVLPTSSNTNAAQTHNVDVTDAADTTDAGTSLCGGTVAQGQELVVTVDSTLVGLVTADGWTEIGGPHFLVEAEGAVVEAGEAQRGCDTSRIINAGTTISLYPIMAGDMTVRLLSAYQFGQVYSSECAMTVTGNREVINMAGYLVDLASWQAADSTLSTAPYELTVETALANQASGFGLLEHNAEDGIFALKYSFDDTGNTKAIEYLSSLETTATDIQVTVMGFVDEASMTSANVVTLIECGSVNTCPGFFTVPVDDDGGLDDGAVNVTEVCIADGLCVTSSIVDEEAGTMTTTITSDDDSWFGVGFSTPGGGMTAGGNGADIFICSAEGLRRFLVTTRSNPETSGNIQEIEQDSADAETILNICSFDDEAGTGLMTFTRPLAGSRPIVVGEDQALIWARGPGEQELTARHDRRGEVSLDLTDIAAAADAGGVTEVKQMAPWILWCHIVFMGFAWAILLPMGVAIANRTRNVEGGKAGAWFGWHKAIGRLGWTLQLLGFLFGVFYCEVYSDHFLYNHTKIGVLVVALGFFQPILAVMRPHPPKGGWPEGKKSAGRWLFECLHKGAGWIAIILGTVNVFLGANLVRDLNFEDVVFNVGIALGAIGAGFFLGFMALCLVMPNNSMSKMITSAKMD